MGRKRKDPNDQRLPPDVYRGKAAYEWRPKDDSGQRSKAIKLCPLSTPIGTVWKHYLDKRETDQTDTLRWLLNQYLASPAFATKAPKTRKEQTYQAANITAYRTGPTRTFGDAKLRAITPGIIRQYLDARANAGAGVGGNREKALISRAWNWALERDLTRVENPCSGVTRNPEAASDRYVTDTEYRIVYELATSYPDDTIYYRVAIAMELAYLCRLRKAEILKATRAQITDEGFDTKRVKRGRDTITNWSPRLRAAIDAALATHGDIPSTYLLSNGKGAGIAEYGFNTAWQRIMARAVEEFGIERYTFHALRAKGVSDFTGENKQDTAGHKDPRMVLRYDRKKRRVDPTE